MATLWQNPYNHYKPWSECQTCGQAWPAQKITYNPRFGWQCPPCWDGLIQHDQYQQPIFPYEGTRKVASPIVHTLTEGIAPGSLYQTYIYNLRDRATGTLYLVHMVPLTITAKGAIVYVGSNLPTITAGNDPLNETYDGITWTNGFNIILENGALTTEPYNPLSTNSFINLLQGTCDFGPAVEQPQGFLLYDRTYTSDIYEVIFHSEGDGSAYPGQIQITPSSGPAVGGILLNDDWSFFIDSFDHTTDILGPQGTGQAQYTQDAFAPEIPWDNSHQFFVDTINYPVPTLIYIP